MTTYPLSTLNILGGGLCGTVLALRALERGHEVRLFEGGVAGSTTRAAAGLVNPVTGMRFTKAAGVDDDLPAAIAFYNRWEAIWKRVLWHPLPILRLFKSPELREGFNKRRSLDLLAPYAVRMIDPGEDVGPVENPYGGVWIERGGWVDLSAWLEAARAELVNRRVWIAQEMDPAEIPDGDTWIDCRGWVPNDTLWQEIPWKPAHGDILTLRISDVPEDRIFNRGTFLLPLGNSLFRYGSTYQWEPASREPTSEGRRLLLSGFKEWIKRDILEILDHRAGIRPIVRDQKPVLGRHVRRPGFWIFNGMGSKGALWAPGRSELLLDCINEGKELPADQNVARFQNSPQTGGRAKR
ncbi:MAG: NAD(P)/FAD-dependent oxidoreductase [Candidatus Methylacidiphilales bacterium]